MLHEAPSGPVADCHATNCTVGQAMRTLLHASCVELAGTGVVLLGPSGSGKSDLALRLIDGGAQLVADDRVVVERQGDRLMARPPEAIAGLIEVRGLGIMRVDHRASSALGLVVALGCDRRGKAAGARHLPDPRSRVAAARTRPADAFGLRQDQAGARG